MSNHFHNWKRSLSCEYVHQSTMKMLWFMLAVSFLFLFMQAKTQPNISMSLSWQVSNQLLPFQIRGVQVGIWDDIVYIIGGNNVYGASTNIYSIPVASILETKVDNQILWTNHGKWDVENDTNVGKSAITKLYCLEMCYTQMSNLVYIAGPHTSGTMLINL